MEAHANSGRPARDAVIHQLVRRAMDDGSFRERLTRNPAKALGEFNLAPEQRAALMDRENVAGIRRQLYGTYAGEFATLWIAVAIEVVVIADSAADA